MITNAESDLPEVLETDVCIAGGGPAGIVLALELARMGHAVVLAEGGGSDQPGSGQSLYEGEVSGPRSYPLAGSRLRWLGGTTNHWGGWVRPLDPVDFQDKSWFPMPAWPFRSTELEPWYARSNEWCEVPDSDYGVASTGVGDSGSVMALDPETGFKNALFRFSPPTRFGQRYQDALEREENIDCRVNLNLVELEQGEDRVRAAVARTFNGGQCRIRASHFVLATGGLENARILLNQGPVPGNQSGLVGGCFMDHFGFSPGYLMAVGGLDYQRFTHRGADLMPVVVPTGDHVMSRERSNACFTFSEADPDSYLPNEYLANPGIATGTGPDVKRFSATMINEPAPWPESRVVLGDDRDSMGQRRLQIDWHLPASDFKRAIGLAGDFSRAVGQAGAGRFKWVGQQPPDDDHVPGLGYHHMGTTRMSADAAYGVVDPDCRVWDRDNLYMAGSSVFPTAGFANPTLTILALCCRLADHLDERISGGGQ